MPAAEISVPVRISRGSSIRVLLIAMAVLAGISFAVQLAQHHLGYEVPRGLVRRLDLDSETSFATWFSSLTLAISAAMLLLIARAKWHLKDPYVAYWAGLSLVFLFLSVDEAVGLHEGSIQPIRQLLNTSGALHAAWVIPATAALVVFALIYLRFLLSLPQKTQRHFVLAATLYVGGAIGFEMLAWGHIYPNYLQNPNDWEAVKDLTFVVLSHSEEVLEMTGVIVFIYALLAYLETSRLMVALRFGGPSTTS